MASALQEADDAVDDFVAKYVSCATCAFWTPELIGGICNAPEPTTGYRSHDTSMCEQHEFKNKELEKQLKALTEKWSNAWQIVEGFLYFDPPVEQL